MKPSVVSFCDLSGNFVKPWADAGYHCVCYDIQHSIRRDRVEGNITYRWADLRSLTPDDLPANVAFAAAWPDCTHLAGSGARDWRRKGIRLYIDALELVDACLRIMRWLGCPWLLENSVGRLSQVLGPPDYTFQPWQYGEDYQKRTCLWTGGGFVMPEPTVTAKPADCEESIWKMPPSADRANLRSRTPMGFARAVFNANHQEAAA